VSLHKKIKRKYETVYGDREQQMYVHLVHNMRGTSGNVKTRGMKCFIESLEPDKTARQERRVRALFKAAELTEISGLES